MEVAVELCLKLDSGLVLLFVCLFFPTKVRSLEWKKSHVLAGPGRSHIVHSFYFYDGLCQHICLFISSPRFI